MGFRSPALDVSALSPAEYEAYTVYLTDILRSGSPTSSAPGGAEDKVDKQVVRLYMVDKLKISGDLFDQLATRVASFPASRLSIGEIFALLRLAAHAQAAGSQDGKQLADDLVFVQVAPIQTSRSSTPSKATYEPRRRVSVKANPSPASAPLPERQDRAVAIAGPPAGLNTRRLAPDSMAPSSTALESPVSAPASTASNAKNPFSAAMGQAESSARAPPPLPPKPVRAESTAHEEQGALKDQNPFRQRLQCAGAVTDVEGGVTEARKSSLISPPLPPRPTELNGLPPVKKTTFTPSTKAASSTSSSSVEGRASQAPAFTVNAGPSGYASYPTPSLIKDGLVAAEKAKQRKSSPAAKPPSSASLEVIRRSADVRLSLPAQSTGGSTVSTDGEVNRRRSGSLLGYKPLGSGQPYNNLNPFEPFPPSAAFSKLAPPQLFVPKAPPAPPPRTKEVVKSAMPLPPPRRKPAANAPSADRMLATANRPRNGSVVSRRVTVGHSDSRRLFEEAAAANPADSSSDEEASGHHGGKTAGPPSARAPPVQRRASAAAGPHDGRDAVPAPAGSTTSSNSVTALRDNLEKMASDVRGEIAWLKGGRGGRWGTIGSHVDGSDVEDTRKSEKQRLVGANVDD